MTQIQKGNEFRWKIVHRKIFYNKKDTCSDDAGQKRYPQVTAQGDF